MKKENIHKILDALHEEDGEVVKAWIVNKYPHGYGLYD